MPQRTQAIRRVRAPFPVGKFNWGGELIRCTIGEKGFMHASDDRSNCFGQPTVSGGKFLALAIQIKVKFDHLGTPPVYRPVNDGR